MIQIINPKRGSKNLNTYIVRIYRSEEGIPHNLVGVVEEVGKKERLAFKSLDDLWDILKRPRGRVRPKHVSKREDGEES